jgi:uncharacterized membrane protein YoaK (UPF0700 family)
MIYWSRAHLGSKMEWFPGLTLLFSLMTHIQYLSRYSGNILRIGHVTGVCTDIGVNVGRYLMGTKDNLWRIQILLALLFTFFFGGCLAQLLHHQLGKYQLLLSAGISFSIGFGYILYLRLSSFQLTFFESIFGFTIQEMNPRESIETNFIISRESILERRSMQLSTIEAEAAYDEDYELTDEEAKQLHCQTNGELLEEQQLNNDEEKVVVDDSSVRNVNEPARSLRRPILPVIPSLAPAPPSTLHPLQKRNKIEFSLIVVGAMLFSLNAGIINSISANASRGYLVSHVTGSTTNAALELSSKRFGEMSIHLALIFSFTFGSFLVGLMVPSSVFRFGISYTRVFLLEGLFLFIAALSNLRVVTNHEDQDQYSLFFYYICSLSCGLQNAIVTKYSGGVIRTTHPTGGFCDIGSIFGRMVTGNTTDLWQLQILIPLVLCFILGGVVGTGLHVWIGRDALLVNVGFIFVVSGWYLFYLKTISRTELTYLQLLFGKYTYPFVNRIRQTITHLRARNTANSSHSNSRQR